MVACACSRVRLIGAWRPLELAGGVTTAVRGFSKLAENFFKKVLDRNRRSVSIVDAPFYGELAQLGERMAGSHEVRGSIPLGSTTCSTTAFGRSFFVDAAVPTGAWKMTLHLRF